MKYRNAMTWLIISAMLAMTAAPISVVAAESANGEPASAPSGQTSEEVYAPILTAFHTRLTEGFSQYQEEDSVLYGVLLNDPDAFSYLWYHDPNLTTENTGYTIFDLNGDGRDELVLGMLDEDGNGTIYDLYTQYEDNVYHIAAAGERDHFALTNRGMIVEQGSASASVSVTIIYEIGRNCLEVYSGFQYDAEAGKNYTIASYQGNQDDSAYEFTWKETEETAEAFAFQNIRLTPFSQTGEHIDESAFFVEFENMGYVAKKFYMETHDVRPTGTGTEITPDGKTATLTLYNDNSDVLASYTIDPRTGIGTDSEGKPVDMSAYAGCKPLTEDDFAVPLNILDDAAKAYYNEQTGSEASGVMIGYDLDIPACQIELQDDEGKALEVYTIDPTTGIGTDSKGNPVDLSVYVEHEIVPEYFTTLTEMERMAVIDYEKKTGIAVEVSEIVTSRENDETVITMTLTDKNGKTLDEYKINPFTGVGTSSNGGAVNLPQTGNNAPGTAAAAAGALLLTVSGLFGIVKSGALRGKEEQ